MQTCMFCAYLLNESTKNACYHVFSPVSATYLKQHFLPAGRTGTELEFAFLAGRRAILGNGTQQQSTTLFLSQSCL